MFLVSNKNTCLRRYKRCSPYWTLALIDLRIVKAVTKLDIRTIKLNQDVLMAKLGLDSLQVAKIVINLNCPTSKKPSGLFDTIALKLATCLILF